MAGDSDNRIGIVVVAAGRGERVGSPASGPKQYRSIGGEPIIRHTVKALSSWQHCGPIVVVIHPDDHDLAQEALAGLPQTHDITLVSGGSTRQQSVLAGLEALAGAAPKHVFIQDAVRPFLDHALLDRLALACRSGERAVLPAVAVADTLKRSTADLYIEDTVSRQNLYAAQTPQAFDYAFILDGHRQAAAAGRTDFTDDTAIAEWLGVRVKIVDGLAGNIKITYAEDIIMADQRLQMSALPDIRCGNGYDVHQLVDGDGVTLCGIFIEHDQKLLGHSDADVALHALTDALLATCGAGDIGDHFPPSDPQWKGAASKIFLEHAANIVRSHGGTIMNADISLIAEAPKVGPHRDRMRQALADMLQIEVERCSVKATTNEKIGFVGRREGIAALATATVLYRRKNL